MIKAKKNPVNRKPYAHLCSITLVLGTSFQNWVSSGTPAPEDWSISAAIIRKRSCREAAKPALKEKKREKCAQTKWQNYKVYRSIFEQQCFRTRASLLQDTGHWLTRNKNNEIIFLSSTILIYIFPQILQFYSNRTSSIWMTQGQHPEFCKECILHQIHLSL